MLLNMPGNLQSEAPRHFDLCLELSRSQLVGRCRREPVSRSRITLYVFIAFIALVIAYYNLVDEPQPEWPVNLIHFICRH